VKDGLGAIQTVLVLGGTSDIGIAVAAGLAGARRATVALAGRHPDALRTAGDRLRNAGAGRVEIIEFDATDTTSHGSFIASLPESLGDIDVAIVAFGLLGEQAADELGGDGAVNVATTNYVGAVSVGLPLARMMKSQGHGTIVFLSSVAGDRVRRANFIYGSSKAGLDGFAQGLSYSLAGSGADVLIVRPGFVHTKMTSGVKPPPFSTTPEAVAEATSSALAAGKRLIYVPARLRPVMAVARHLPHQVLARIDR
jgi:decaprenylphospho-beta-D-erythro-pentofuranosid-2-ulose 2-reductase